MGSNISSQGSIPRGAVCKGPGEVHQDRSMRSFFVLLLVTLILYKICDIICREYKRRRKLDLKTYLFDFDGTLVDSMPTYVSVMLRVLDENNIAYDDDIIKTITPLGYEGTAKYYKTLGVPSSVESIIADLNAYAKKEYEECILSKNNVIDVLRELKRRGASLNVLTASPHTMLDCCLKRLGIFDLFENVWSCDDFHTTKANPEIYKEAAKRLGVGVEDVIFLDDNFNAVKTAKAAGMHVYGVYDESSRDYVDDMKSISERYISDFSELL